MQTFLFTLAVFLIATLAYWFMRTFINVFEVYYHRHYELDPNDFVIPPVIPEMQDWGTKRSYEIIGKAIKMTWEYGDISSKRTKFYYSKKHAQKNFLKDWHKEETTFYNRNKDRTKTSDNDDLILKSLASSLSSVSESIGMLHTTQSSHRIRLTNLEERISALESNQTNTGN